MKPKKILIACIHWAVSSGRYMTDAFRRIGCDVRTVGPYMANEIWGLKVDDRYCWEPTYTATPQGIYDYPIKELLSSGDGWEPDLIVCMDSQFTLTGEKVDFPCPKILYGVDNHAAAYGREGEWYDKRFLAHSQGPALKVEDPDVWLPCAYDPAVFWPSPIPMKDRYFDVSILGFPYPQRTAIVEAMREAGINVYADMGKVYNEYRDIYHNTKISLCVSGAGDVGQRVFETAAMGCAILTDICHDFDKLQMQHHLNYERFRSTAEAVKVAIDNIGDEDHLADVGHFCREWAKSHTWDNRAKQILETMKI